MSDREAFIAKIIEDPDSDTPRLVFADWLDEHGEPDLAEFIRVQCELARLDGKGTAEFAKLGIKPAWSKVISSEADALRAREKELFEANRWDFLRWLTTEFPGVCEDSEFHRGFVETITCTWADWLTHHEQILAATPLREVRLTTRPTYQWVGNVADLGSPPESGMEHAWPRLKFTLPSPIILPSGLIPSQTWTDDASGPLFSFRASEMPIIYEQGFARAVESITPSLAASPPAPPNDPSSDDGNI